MSKKTSRKTSRPQRKTSRPQRKTSRPQRKTSRKTSRPQRKTSRKTSRPQRKTSRKTSRPQRKTSRKTSRPQRKTSRKTSRPQRKTSRKTTRSQRKTSRKVSRKASRKTSTDNVSKKEERFYQDRIKNYTDFLNKFDKVLNHPNLSADQLYKALYHGIDVVMNEIRDLKRPPIKIKSKYGKNYFRLSDFPSKCINNPSNRIFSKNTEYSAIKMVIKYLKEKENFDMKGLKLKGPSNYKYRQVLTENMFEQYKDVIANIFEHNIKDELNDAPYPRECY